MDYTVGKFIKFIIAIIILAALGWLVMALSSTITIIIISALIAYILDPLASFLEYKGLSRTMATVVLFLVIAGILAGIFSFLIPPLISEIQLIERNVASGEATRFFIKIENMIQDNIPLLDIHSLNLQKTFTDALANISSSIFSIIGSMVTIITTLVIIPFAVFFMLKDGRELKKAFISLVPNRYFEMVLSMLHKIDLQLGGYLRGQFFDAMIIGILSTLALWILDVPYFLLIGIFAGLANMIPYVGPMAGAVSALLMVLISNGSNQQLIFVIIAFVIIQLLDNVLVQPLVVARSVNLHPLIVIFAVIIGGQFFGILGMLLAVPVAGMFKVLGSQLYQGFRKYQKFV